MIGKRQAYNNEPRNKQRPGFSLNQHMRLGGLWWFIYIAMQQGGKKIKVISVKGMGMCHAIKLSCPNLDLADVGKGFVFDINHDNRDEFSGVHG